MLLSFVCRMFGNIIIEHLRGPSLSTTLGMVLYQVQHIDYWETHYKIIRLVMMSVLIPRTQLIVHSHVSLLMYKFSMVIFTSRWFFFHLFFEGWVKKLVNSLSYYVRWQCFHVNNTQFSRFLLANLYVGLSFYPQ